MENDGPVFIRRENNKQMRRKKIKKKDHHREKKRKKFQKVSKSSKGKFLSCTTVYLNYDRFCRGWSNVKKKKNK